MSTPTQNGIPETTQVLVVGGGPAGSYAAAALAREGLDVVLLDMSKFPRYHVGESLLPSVRHYLRFIDAEEKVASYGFVRKPGSAIKFTQFMSEGYTDFVALGASNNAWNVVRSQFDELLLKHAASCGVKVFTQTKVEGFEFAPYAPESKTSASARSRSSSLGGLNIEFERMGRPVKASYTTTDGVTGEIGFEYLVDASGRAGLLSTKYLKNRQYNQSLKNVAVWGYWRGTGMYGKGTPRENAPFFEALSDESGWAWFIPLHNGLTSVGIVMDQKQLGVRSRAASSSTSTPLPASPLSNPLFSSMPSFTSMPSKSNEDSNASGTSASAKSSAGTGSARMHSTLAERYLTFLHLAPGVQALIGGAAELVNVEDEKGDAPAARSASDFSYQAEEYAGVGWRIVGDAGAFIDPFFSSGVHLAMTGAISAAASIAASVRGDCGEAEAAAWHSKRVAISYTRFLVVVLSAYKQIRAQSTNVLADVDEDNFDKAFAFFRPVIQGGAEMGKRLSEDEVQRALDFCVRLFDPTTPEQHASVLSRLRQTMWQPSELDELTRSGGIGTRDDATMLRGTPASMRGTPDASMSMRRMSDALKTPERLLDVRAPVVDPGFLARFMRARLSLSFLRRSAGEADTEPSSPASSTFSSFFGGSVNGGGSAGSAWGSSSRSSLDSGSEGDKEGEHEDMEKEVDKDDEHGDKVVREHQHQDAEEGEKARDENLDAEKDKAEHQLDAAEMEKEEKADAEMRMVLDKVNARRVIHAEHGEGLNSLEEEAVGGLVVRLERGRLGLVRVKVADSEPED